MPGSYRLGPLQPTLGAADTKGMKRALRYVVYPAGIAAVVGGTMLVVGAAPDKPSLVAPGSNAPLCSTVTVAKPKVAGELAVNQYLEALTAAQLKCVLELQ